MEQRISAEDPDGGEVHGEWQFVQVPPVQLL